MTAPARAETIHATAVVIGERGVLIRGVSGAGKSRIAQALLDAAERGGKFGRLVADDRVMVRSLHQRVIARPHPAIAGRIEERGAGLLPVAHEPAVRIACIIDIEAAQPARLPAERESSIAGVALPALSLPAGLAPDESAARILRFLHRNFL